MADPSCSGVGSQHPLHVYNQQLNAIETKFQGLQQTTTHDRTSINEGLKQIFIDLGDLKMTVEDLGENGLRHEYKSLKERVTLLTEQVTSFASEIDSKFTGSLPATKTGEIAEKTKAFSVPK